MFFRDEQFRLYFEASDITFGHHLLTDADKSILTLGAAALTLRCFADQTMSTIKLVI